MTIPPVASYGALTAACFGSLYVSTTDDTFFLAAVGVVLAYAVLGTLKITNLIGDSNINSKINEAYDFLDTYLPVLALPALTSSIWTRHRVLKEKTYNYGHIIAGAGLAGALTTRSVPQDYFEYLVGTECLSLVVGSLYKENYYATAAGMLFGAAYYLTHIYNGPDNFPVPKDDLYRFILAAFVYAAMLAANAPKCPLH